MTVCGLKKMDYWNAFGCTRSGCPGSSRDQEIPGSSAPEL
jgi:hypothetical protein